MPLGAFFVEDVPLVECLYPVFTRMPDGFTIGDSDLSRCVCVSNIGYICHWGHPFWGCTFSENFYPVFTRMLDGVTVGDSGLCCCMCLKWRVYTPLWASCFEDVLLVEFIYIVFTRMPDRVTVGYSCLYYAIWNSKSTHYNLGRWQLMREKGGGTLQYRRRISRCL